MSNNLINLNIDIDDEYKPMLNDLIKMFTILVVVNVLMYISDPSQNKLLGESYIKLLIFILLGVCTYWLIINKLVKY